MIVEKLWTTHQRKSFGFHYDGNTYDSCTKSWRGWFLFGIIPLYIKNTHTTYSR